MADEKEIRLHEVEQLEKHCNDHAVGMDNPGHTIRVFIERRKKEIHDLFASKPEEPVAPPAAPVEPPAVQEPPASEGVPGEETL